jgi:drug/metabolite transporter, DME family
MPTMPERHTGPREMTADQEVLMSRLGVGAIGLAAALWAVAAVVASDLFEAGVPPIELAEARAFIAAAGFGLLSLLPLPVGRLSNAAAPRRGLGRWHIIALGLAIALVNAAYYLAIDRLPVAVALVLQYSAPVLVVAWAALVAGRKPSVEILVALGAAVAGVVLVAELPAGDLGGIDALGFALGLASAVLFAAYTILSEPAGARYGPVGAMRRAFAVASAVWFLFQIPRGWPAELLEPANVLDVLYVGLFGTLAPFLLFVWAIGHVRPERATIAATLEPVVGAAVAWIWLDQALSAMQIGGGVLVITAVALLQIRRPRAPAPEP